MRLYRLWQQIDSHWHPLLMWTNFNPSMDIHYKVWEEITYPLPSFNGCTVEVSKWISIFIPHVIGRVIFYTPVWKMDVLCRLFFQHALRYQFETWYMHSVGGTTCRVWVSTQLGHFDLLYSQKEVKLNFCNRGLINQGKFFKFDT